MLNNTILSFGIAALAAIIITGSFGLSLFSAAYAQQTAVETSADDFDGRFFGKGLVQVVVTDENQDNGDSVDDISIDIDADPDSGSGGSSTFTIPETSESSGRFEFYLMHVDADGVDPNEIDPINTQGVEGATGAGATAAPVITFGPSGADLVVEGAQDPYEQVSFEITVDDTTIELNYEETIAEVELDRTNYGSNSFVYVSVIDQDANLNPTARDEFTVDPDASPNDDLLELDGGLIEQAIVFRETGDNTARFEARYELGASIAPASESLVLTLHDKANYGADLDAEENDSAASDEVSFTIGNSGGSVGVNEGNNNQEQNSDPVFDSDRTRYQVGEEVQITITDQDANADANAVDTITLEAVVDSSGQKSEIEVTETGVNTGVFEAEFTLVVTFTTEPDLIRVRTTDRVTITYTDLYSATGVQKDFSYTIQVGSTDANPIDSILPSTPAIKDITGKALPSLAVGQQGILSTSITNNKDEPQPFVALVEVRDADGITVFLAWQTGTVNPSGLSEVGLSWTPDKQGDYLVRTFVLSGLGDNTQVLSPVSESSVKVS